MFTISLNRVHDTIKIVEGEDAIILHVDADPMRVTAGLNQAAKVMQELNEDSGEQKERDAALFFAGAIFGQRQAEDLLAFYHNNAACVINVTGRYFQERLRGMIVRAQKRK